MFAEAAVSGNLIRDVALRCVICAQSGEYILRD